MDRLLIGGVVAYNEERHIEAALDSLLGQTLPRPWRWGTVWVVASGCTDRTTEIVQGVVARDPRVRLIVEPDRGGKARAIGEILRRATGDALVLLNSDARAAPGAITELLRTAEGHSPPFGVMGRPSPSSEGPDPVGGMLRLLWDLHAEFHREILADGGGTHLSDELLLLSVPRDLSLPEVIINDGSFFGAWLARHHGDRLYSPRAVVETDPPTSFRDHLVQRRRIRVGHRQVARLLGVVPSELSRYSLAHPRAALGLVRRAFAQGHFRLRDLAYLVLGEVAATALAEWDRIPPRRDHVRWERITSGTPATPIDRSVGDSGIALLPRGGEAVPHVAASTSFLDLRVESLLRVARRFRTGIPLEELGSLLPAEGPSDVHDLRRWLDARPTLARVDGDRVFPANDLPARLSERESRATEYRQAAEHLVDHHLRPVLPWVRCVGITGSTAYGVPEAGDDLDLFVVTRTGSLWVFLAYTYVAVRLGFRPMAGTARPPPCFNYVLEDRQAETEFASARGFLFAREALTARIFRGENYYQDLLATAPWLGTEIPRLYAQRTSGVPPRGEPPAPWVVRLVNAALFPPLAAYLQLAGLRRNALLRSRRELDARFRTVTAPRRLAFVSERFDRLRADLAPATIAAREEPSMGGPSRFPTAR
ncbi:MAG: glycosyltransferase family A protein [Thermoplasmata archaeon]